MAFTPRFTQRSMISPAVIVRPPKLYGTFNPTCTPAHLELGLPCESAFCLNPIGLNRPSEDRASLTASRRLKGIAFSKRSESGLRSAHDKILHSLHANARG